MMKSMQELPQPSRQQSPSRSCTVSDAHPYPPSYLRAVSNKFTPERLRTSLQTSGTPIFLVGPTMIPAVLKDKISPPGHPLIDHAFDIAKEMTPATLLAHTLYIEDMALPTPLLLPLRPSRHPARNANSNSDSNGSANATPSPALTTHPSPSTLPSVADKDLNTVTGLAVFNLSREQRNALFNLEIAPFKHFDTVHIEICLTDGISRTIDAGAFIWDVGNEIRTLSGEGGQSQAGSSGESSCGPLSSPRLADEHEMEYLGRKLEGLLSGMKRYRMAGWDVREFVGTSLYRYITRGYQEKRIEAEEAPGDDDDGASLDGSWQLHDNWTGDKGVDASKE
ncbi:hypothetical protein FQN53_006701 [Emmonsiellopsis sp. PD_33]|nr:hypothetical protein FQN53_006701 [Emmonsiellopsis sp. PD_33]